MTYQNRQHRKGKLRFGAVFLLSAFSDEYSKAFLNILFMKPFEKGIFI